MNTWSWVAVAIGVFLIVVLLIRPRRPKDIQSVLDRPAQPVSPKMTAKPAQLSSGSLAYTPLRTLLVGLKSSRATGTLTVTRADQVCAMYMLFGHLFHATCGDAQGEQAVHLALSWSDGSYVFDKKSTLPTEETVSRPLEEVLDQAAN